MVTYIAATLCEVSLSTMDVESIPFEPNWSEHYETLLLKENKRRNRIRVTNKLKKRAIKVSFFWNLTTENWRACLFFRREHQAMCAAAVMCFGKEWAWLLSPKLFHALPNLLFPNSIWLDWLHFFFFTCIKIHPLQCSLHATINLFDVRLHPTFTTSRISLFSW